MFEEFSSMVANLGFPIAAFFSMLYLANKTIKETATKTQGAIEKNTQAVNSLKELVKSCLKKF